MLSFAMPSDIAAEVPEQAARVAQIAQPYLWWAPADGQSHGFARMVAQIMNLGTYDDILRLEEAVEPQVLAAVMIDAQPGWFDARSWAFWRGRLGFRIGVELPETSPKRRFGDVAHP